MNHDHIRPAQFHSAKCRCARCTPGWPGDRFSLNPVDRVCLLMFAGMATGAGIFALAGMLGPALRAMFGL